MVRKNSKKHIKIAHLVLFCAKAIADSKKKWKFAVGKSITLSF